MFYWPKPCTSRSFLCVSQQTIHKLRVLFSDHTHRRLLHISIFYHFVVLALSLLHLFLVHSFLKPSVLLIHLPHHVHSFPFTFTPQTFPCSNPPPPPRFFISSTHLPSFYFSTTTVAPFLVTPYPSHPVSIPSPFFPVPPPLVSFRFLSPLSYSFPETPPIPPLLISSSALRFSYCTSQHSAIVSLPFTLSTHPSPPKIADCLRPFIPLLSPVPS